jgi:hypothetical protein
MVMVCSLPMTVRLSRPVLNPETDRVEEVVGREIVTHTIQGKKNFKN